MFGCLHLSKVRYLCKCKYDHLFLNDALCIKRLSPRMVKNIYILLFFMTILFQFNFFVDVISSFIAYEISVSWAVNTFYGQRKKRMKFNSERIKTETVCFFDDDYFWIIYLGPGCPPSLPSDPIIFVSFLTTF